MVTAEFEFIEACDDIAALIEAGELAPDDVLKSIREAEPIPRSLRHPDHARLIDPIKKRMTRLFAKYFRRQEQAVLDDVKLRFHVGKEYRESLRRAGVLQLREDDGDKRAAELLPDALAPLTFATTAKEDDDYLGMIKLAIQRAEKQLADEIATDARIPETRMSEYLRNNSLSKLTGELSETSKQRLRDAIADAVNSGGMADDIVAAIKAEFNEFSTRRSEMIAATEINDAYNFGRHEIADAAGMEEKRWVTESGNPCEDCEENEDEEWIGITELFPGGVMMPTQHPLCACACDYRLVSSGEGK